MFNEEMILKPNVLIVDDLSQNIYALQKILDCLDINIDTAESGNEALLLMLEKSYAVVILDVQMPEMDGFEVAKVMHENDDTKYTPIIFVTAISKEEEHISFGYEVGAVDYLFKPVDPQILRCKVKVFIDLYKIENQLKKAKYDIENTLNSVTDSIISVDKQCCIQYCNPAASSILGMQATHLVNCTLFDVLTFTGIETEEMYHAKIQNAICNQEKLKFNEKIRVDNALGNSYIVELATVPLLNIASQYMGVVFTIHDVTESQKLTEKLHFNATHDPLTRLPNRFHFIDILNNTIRHSKLHNEMFAVLFLDLDEFKQINDSLGHHIGDQLLKLVAERLAIVTHAADMFARVGGDEFIIVLEKINSEENAAQISQYIINELDRPFTLDEQNVCVGSSIGISIFPEDGDDAETLMKNADKAMCSAKEQGRNSYCFFEKSFQDKAEQNLELNNNLRKAIRDDGFVVYYQPQFSLVKDRIIGVESLVRWKNSNEEFISPAKFIPVAERSGLIKPIGNLVLQHSCSALQNWLSFGFEEMQVSVNVSYSEFYDKGFIENIVNCLDSYQLKPKNLEVEITEGVFIKDEEKFITILNQLKEIGVSIAIDDFGTGYSNLSYLKNLPVDILKIDQVFIRNILASDKDKAIVRAILELGKQLELMVIAEGVETEEHLKLLRHYGCDIIQGYLYAKPMPSEDIVTFLNNSDELKRKMSVR